SYADRVSLPADSPLEGGARCPVSIARSAARRASARFASAATADSTSTHRPHPSEPANLRRLSRGRGLYLQLRRSQPFPLLWRRSRAVQHLRRSPAFPPLPRSPE